MLPYVLATVCLVLVAAAAPENVYQFSNDDIDGNKVGMDKYKLGVI